MTLDRYWDLEDSQRAKLTEDQVKGYLAVELMEKGVPHHPGLVLDKVDEPQVKTTPFYQVCYAKESYSTPAALDPIFRTKDDAEAFIRMDTLVMEREYSTKINWVEDPGSFSITIVDLSTKEDVQRQRELIQRAKATSAANDRKAREYGAVLKKREDATKEVWEDWHAQRETARKCGEIAKTFEEYLDLCKGDHELAMTFLVKAFDEEDIAEAKIWLGGKLFELITAATE